MKRTTRVHTYLFCFLVLVTTATSVASEELTAKGHCEYFQQNQKQLYWGDLHVHTGYSLDAYAFGNRHSPGDAYAFARGQQLTLADGQTKVQIDRPLDFMAVTDHAETFDLMYLCSDPMYLDDPYCKGMRSGSVMEGSLTIFRNYLLPLIAGDVPQTSPICESSATKNEQLSCGIASQRQWRRSQEQANAANVPCQFTTFIGNEWSATPNNKHWHRNLIYASDKVSEQAIDYLRYPTVEALWQALDTQCTAEEGCDVIAIPHNTNLAEGGGFDIESSSDAQLKSRARYERLIEIFQSKGGSECLPEHWDDQNTDCNFERVLPRHSEQALKDRTLSEEQWQHLRASYVRNIVGQGLKASSKKGATVNPLQLGFIGSTDVHAATAGMVAEQGWTGDAWGWGDDSERRFSRMNYNPGGLVAVWAEENTRESIFSALKRREVFATSGPRIAVKFSAYANDSQASCNNLSMAKADTVMGGVLSSAFTNSQSTGPGFVIQAQKDHTSLAGVELIKTSIKDGQTKEQVIPLLQSKKGRNEICLTWKDPDFDNKQPALWYVRVLEQPTPRWSKFDCEQANNCKKYREAEQLIQERAWSSPIWYLPLDAQKFDTKTEAPLN